MEKTIAIFTIFTLLLFSVTTASIALGQFGSDSSTKSIELADLADVVSIENPKSELDQTISNDHSPESEYTQPIDLSTIDPTPRLRFARSRPIKRHFFDKSTRIPLRFVRRHPCRKFQKKFMLPRTERSYGNDMIVSSKTSTYSVDTKAFGGDQVPTELLEFKHRYGHHHHHHNRDEESVPQFMFSRENSINSRHHKREHKGGFMRSIRKFLKHTFD